MKILAAIKLLRHFKEVNTYKRLTKCDILFICHDVDRSLNLNSKAYSPIIDSILEDLQNLGLNCKSFALPLSELTGKKAFNNPYSANRFYLLTRLISKLKFPFDVLNFYGTILNKAQPKVVFTIGSNPELALAIKKINAYHIEILHGIGYTKIEWGWEFFKAEELPHEVMTLDYVSLKNFEPLKSKGIEVSYIPHPFLRRFNNNQKIYQEWEVAKSEKYPKQLLISLQWGYGGDHGEFQELAGILENGLFYPVIEDLIQKRSDILWRFRLHPVQSRKRKYSKTKRLITDLCSKYKNTEWFESSTLPIPSILQSCIGHITMSSMTSYEAANFDVPTYAMCPTLKSNGHKCNLFEDLVKNGMLVKGEPTISDINDWINQLRINKKRFLKDETPLYEEIIRTVFHRVKSYN